MPKNTMISGLVTIPIFTKSYRSHKMRQVTVTTWFNLFIAVPPIFICKITLARVYYQIYGKTAIVLIDIDWVSIKPGKCIHDLPPQLRCSEVGWFRACWDISQAIGTQKVSAAARYF